MISENLISIVPISLVLLARAAVNRIVRVEYERYNEQWVSDKRPWCDYFWWRLPRGIVWHSAQRAAFVATVKWLFRTPKWIREDVAAYRWLRLLRISCILGVVSVIAADYVFTH